jgi:hypothetical protein
MHSFSSRPHRRPGWPSLTWLVDVQRPPFPSAASRLSAANSDPHLLSSPQSNSSNACLTRRHESIRGVSSLENKSRTSRAGDLDDGVHMTFLKPSVPRLPDNSRSRGSQLPVFTQPSPLLYHTWHGYRVTHAHHVEVVVSACGNVSATPCGAAAAAPSEGANG